MSYNTAPNFIKTIIDDTIDKEGGYVNNPNDSGGETKYGITYITARKYGIYGSIVDLSIEQAREIYSGEYFYRPKLDRLYEVSEEICQEVFDAGVLSGQIRAVKWLQRVLNVLNRTEKDYKDIAEDGYIGDATIRALREYLLKRGRNGQKVLFNLLNCLQGEFFVSLAAKREKDEEFVYGWASNRLKFL